MKFHKKGGKKPKKHFKKSKPNKKKKTYSIYPNKKEQGDEDNENKFKRKGNFRGNNKNKIFKKEGEIINEETEQNHSEEEEHEVEEDDHLTQLRSTFKTSVTKAIDTSESESEVEEEDVVEEESADDAFGLDSEEEDEAENALETDDEEKIDENALETDDEEKIDENDDEEDEIENNDDENNATNSNDNNTDESEEDIDLVEEEENNEKDKIIAIDPFVKHILYDMNENLLNSVQQTPQLVETHEQLWPELGKLCIQIPKCEEIVEETAFSICEKKIYAPGGTIPELINLNKTKLEELHIKSPIVNNLKSANASLNSLHKSDLPLTKLQAELFSIINNYQDLYYPQRTFDNAEELRFVYCLHAINHLQKERAKIVRHNERLAKKDDVPEDFRDKGLVRPKVLIIVPFRHSAYKIIKTIMKLMQDKKKGAVVNENRFVAEFTGSELVMPKKIPKPEDYELLFAGNSNDDFKIGLSITKKTLKLYSKFYVSDMIVASPLGLRYILGAEGETDRDYDFLASIELVILDQTDVFLMQNWDHVLHIFNHLHLQPKESHGTDFARVRTWCLNGWSKYYRQTLIFSATILPEINSIFNRRCFNYAGKVKVINPVGIGTISKVHVQLPHIYQKFETSSAAQAIEDRFKFFVERILPKQKDSLMKQTMIYISNYFDFVRLRNYFKKEDINFVQACEYSKEGKVARARDMFYHGDGHFLLYTERYHFFHRRRIKGIRHLIFYQPPNIPHFYYEMCNLMQEGNMNKQIGNTSNMTVTILYSKYDIIQLSAVIGSERAMKMLSSDRNVHMLLTD